MEHIMAEQFAFLAAPIAAVLVGLTALNAVQLGAKLLHRGRFELNESVLSALRMFRLGGEYKIRR